MLAGLCAAAVECRDPERVLSAYVQASPYSQTRRSYLQHLGTNSKSCSTKDAELAAVFGTVLHLPDTLCSKPQQLVRDHEIRK